MDNQLAFMLFFNLQTRLHELYDMKSFSFQKSILWLKYLIFQHYFRKPFFSLNVWKKEMMSVSKRKKNVWMKRTNNVGHKQWRDASIMSNVDFVAIPIFGQSNDNFCCMVAIRIHDGLAVGFLNQTNIFYSHVIK